MCSLLVGGLHAATAGRQGGELPEKPRHLFVEFAPSDNRFLPPRGGAERRN
jgi:hypothetical protein